MLIKNIIVGAYLCASLVGGAAVDAESIVFRGDDGKTIQIDLAANRLTEADGKVSYLLNCSNEVEFCFTNKTNFLFSFYKRCNDLFMPNGPHLSFKRRTAWALHGDSWFFYEEAPHYLFQDRDGVGVVAIYIGAHGDFDFRGILNDQKLNSESPLFRRYALASEASFGLCKS